MIPTLKREHVTHVTVVTPKSMSQAICNDLSVLAVRVLRLAPSHRDPEKFHEDKSEIVGALRRLAKKVRRHG